MMNNTWNVDSNRTVTHRCNQLQSFNILPRLRGETGAMHKEYTMLAWTTSWWQSFFVMHRHWLQWSHKHKHHAFVIYKPRLEPISSCCPSYFDVIFSKSGLAIIYYIYSAVFTRLVVEAVFDNAKTDAVFLSFFLSPSGWHKLPSHATLIQVHTAGGHLLWVVQAATNTERL